MNDLFLFINRPKVPSNSADDNTLAYYSKTLNLIEVLEEESGVALTWLQQNQTIANAEKFHALLIRTDPINIKGENLIMQGKITKSEETVTSLDIKLDHKPNLKSISLNFAGKMHHK